MMKLFLQPRRNDNKIVTNALGHFDGFHVGATTPSSAVQFVQEVGKPFLVDPMTYMFALPVDSVVNKTGEVRPSVLDVAERYLPVFRDLIGRRSLLPEDLLLSRNLISDLTFNVLNYERTKFDSRQPTLINRYYDKYDALDRAGASVEYRTQATEPFLLVPPFFLVRDITDPWYQVSLTCARLATEHKRNGERLFPVLFMAKECLADVNAVRRIAQDYSVLGFEGVIVWVNGLAEESSDPVLLSNLTKLISLFRRNGKAVMKWHGGYFSVLLGSVGLSSLSCNLSYSSSRDIFAYKWIAPAPPKPKYYVPLLHQSYDLERAERILRQYPFLRCDCGVCASAYDEHLDSFQDRMSVEGYCQNHFLNCRKRELRAFSSYGIRGAMEEISATLNQLGSRRAVGAKHLSKWRDVFSIPAIVTPRPTITKDRPFDLSA